MVRLCLFVRLSRLSINGRSCFQEGDELMEWWNTVKGAYEHLFCLVFFIALNFFFSLHSLHLMIVIFVLLVARLDRVE